MPDRRNVDEDGQGPSFLMQGHQADFSIGSDDTEVNQSATLLAVAACPFSSCPGQPQLSTQPAGLISSDLNILRQDLQANF